MNELEAWVASAVLVSSHVKQWNDLIGDDPTRLPVVLQSTGDQTFRNLAASVLSRGLSALSLGTTRATADQAARAGVSADELFAARLLACRYSVTEIDMLMIQPDEWGELEEEKFLLGAAYASYAAVRMQCLMSLTSPGRLSSKTLPSGIRVSRDEQGMLLPIAQMSESSPLCTPTVIACRAVYLRPPLSLLNEVRATLRPA